MAGFWDKENIDICIEMIKISGGHFGKWPPFVLYGFIYAKNGTTIFLFYNNTYLVIKIMIIRWLDAEIKERQKSLAAILKNGSHFVFGTNLRWPYILKSLLGHILSLCQISNFYHKVHDSLKFWRIPLPLIESSVIPALKAFMNGFISSSYTDELWAIYEDIMA